LFSGDKALQDALTLDSAHIVEGAIGPHVEKIQTALLLLSNPPCVIAESELSAHRYGRTTANAVLRYKTEHQIINRSYQSKPDNIVGKMTMRALDDAVVEIEAELAACILGILAHLDQLLLQSGVMLSPTVRGRFEKVKATALALSAPAGGLRTPGPRFTPVYREALEFMDRMVRYRPPIVFVVAAAIVVVGAVVIFLAAIAAIIAIQAMRGNDPFRGARTVGSRVNVILTEAIEAGEQAIVEDVVLVDALAQAVDICRRRSQNPTQDCTNALNEFDAKKRDLVAKRNEFQQIIQQLKDARDGDPKKLVWKLLMRRAETIAREFNTLEVELLDIARKVITACGCRFIKIPEKTPPLVIFDLFE